MFAQTNFNGAFTDYVPSEVVFKGFNEGVISKIMEEQARKITINRRLFDKYSEFEDEEALYQIPNPYIHILFDDTVADRQVHDSDVLNELAYYGRHFRLSTWVNTQHGHALNPGFRANADVAVSFEQIQKNQRDTVREEFLNFFTRKRDFDTFFDDHTEKRKFLAIHTADMELPWYQRIYGGISDPAVKPLKLGCAQFWKMHDQPSIMTVQS